MNVERTSYKPRPPGTLKDAEDRLVNAVGGQEKAADICGRSRSVMARYTDPGEPGRHMPVDVVRRLERAADYPHVSAFLAREVGYGLMPFDVAGQDALPHLLAVSAREHGEVIAKAMEALGDLVITPEEAGGVIKEVDEALTALQAVRAQLIAIRGDRTSVVDINRAGEGA